MRPVATSMTFGQLQVLVAVARHGSVKAAALALRVSQAAVSQAVAGLRLEFDDQLYLRRGRGVTLTPRGRQLVGVAGEILGLVDQARRLGGDSPGQSQPLRLATTGSVAEYVVAALLEAFGRRLPELEIQVAIDQASRFEDLLRLHQADVTIGPDPIVGFGIESVRFLRYEMVVIAGSHHGPARGGEFAGLIGEPWLLGPYDTDPVSEVGRVLSVVGIDKDEVKVFPSHAAASAAAASGHGVSLALAHTVAEELDQGILSRVEVAGTPVKGLWYVSTLAGNAAPASARALRHFVTMPEATRATLHGRGGVPPRRVHPPTHITLWSGIPAVPRGWKREGMQSA